MIIPFDQLSKETLNNVIEEFVTREGTDYGEMEISLSQKCLQVFAQLKTGDIVLVFDQATETINLIPKEDAPAE
jgi:uncharacterized protein YheU (UPF0270 family)